MMYSNQIFLSTVFFFAFSLENALACTPRNGDVWVTHSEIDCCPGLQKVEERNPLNDVIYVCRCTSAGHNMYENKEKQKIQCCPGSREERKWGWDPISVCQSIITPNSPTIPCTGEGAVINFQTDVYGKTTRTECCKGLSERVIESRTNHTICLSDNQGLSSDSHSIYSTSLIALTNVILLTT
eukprot:Pgem_evm1s7090